MCSAPVLPRVGWNVSTSYSSLPNDDDAVILPTFWPPMHVDDMIAIGCWQSSAPFLFHGEPLQQLAGLG